MAAEKVGFFEEIAKAKRQKEDAYNAQITAMEIAINAKWPGALTSEPTPDLDDLDATETEVALLSSTPLLPHPQAHEAGWAIAVLNSVKELKVRNPINTEFLTGVLKTTAGYINSINDKLTFGDTAEQVRETAHTNYVAMTKEVHTKYGRYSALSVALLGLPVSIFIGGMVGAVALGIVFPPLLTLFVVGGALTATFGMAAGTIPYLLAGTISDQWKDVKNETAKAPGVRA